MERFRELGNKGYDDSYDVQFCNGRTVQRQVRRGLVRDVHAAGGRYKERIVRTAAQYCPQMEGQDDPTWVRRATRGRNRNQLAERLADWAGHVR